MSIIARTTVFSNNKTEQERYIDHYQLDHIQYSLLHVKKWYLVIAIASIPVQEFSLFLPQEFGTPYRPLFVAIATSRLIDLNPFTTPNSDPSTNAPRFLKEVGAIYIIYLLTYLLIYLLTYNL